MNRQRYLPLLGVALFCLTSMAGCPNDVPAGQATTVKGVVTNLRTGKPLASVRMVLATTGNYPGPSGNYTKEADSTWTDLAGNYSFSFINEYGLYYGISCEGIGFNPRFKLDLPDSIITGYNPRSLRTIDLEIGRANSINFKPSPQRVFAVQVSTRQTGYQRLSFNGLSPSPADNQSRTAYLYQSVPFFSRTGQSFYQTPARPLYATFSRTLASGATQDTLIQTKTSTPLTGDTVRATLTFRR